MTITRQLLENFQQEFEANPIHRAVAPAVAKSGLEAASLNQESIRRHNFRFSDKTQQGEITDQKQSGRCWLFAALNAARVEAMKKHEMESLEFSQTYLFFWDKLERSNYFLEVILETAGEELHSRLLGHLLAAPQQDGGQWDMAAGIMEKYGVVPKEAMPDTYLATASLELNKLLNSYLRYFASELRQLVREGRSEKELRERKEKQLSTVYNILVKAFGNPPTQVVYEYEDKQKCFHRLPAMTPQQFFKHMVGWDLSDKLSLINAPTKDKPYGRAFTVKYLGSVKEARPICYINTPIEVLKQAAIASIQAGEAVWFGCDMGKYVEKERGIMDHEVFLLPELVGTELPWSKALRLEYGESCPSHAMVFTGVDLNDNGDPVNWRVENSWGKDRGRNGQFSMSDLWFDHFVYQIMVDKRYVEEQWLKALEQPIIELEPWDPIGTLA